MQKPELKNKILSVDDESLSDELISAFIRKNFEPSKTGGIVYTAARTSTQDISRLRRLGAKIISAKADGKLVGLHIMLISPCLFRKKRIFCPIRCVDDSCRGQGIGADMFRKAESIATADCLYSFISTAFSSPENKKALEKLGYRKWRIASWDDSNYYSVVYRKDLSPSIKLWRLAYPFSRLLCPLCKNADGSFTFFGKIFWRPILAILKCAHSKIRKKCKV